MAQLIRVGMGVKVRGRIAEIRPNAYLVSIGGTRLALTPDQIAEYEPASLSVGDTVRNPNDERTAAQIIHIDGDYAVAPLDTLERLE